MLACRNCSRARNSEAATGPGFNWQDANVFRIGANYQYNSQLQLRAGYAFIRDSETFLIVAPATVQSQFTAGEFSIGFAVGYKFDEPAPSL